MNKNIDIHDISDEEMDAVLASVLSGEHTPEEYAIFNAWIEADPAHAEEFRELKSYWNASINDRFDVDPNKELSKLMKRVEASGRKKKIFSLKTLWLAGAVAAALVAGVFLGFNFSKTRVVHSDRYSLMTGESISSFTLPDGSKVHLNKDSRLDYEEGFGKNERKVYLHGEAYFDVTRNEDCKFIVDLDGASITVKGTSFDAFNHEDSGIKGAALVSGSIEFQSNSQYLQLAPSRQVIYNETNNELSISAFDPSVVTAWKDRLFRYKSLTLPELVGQLMEEYGMNIVIADDDFGDSRYSGALDIALPPPSIMDLITMQAGAVWTKKSDIYYIHRQ